MREPAPFKTFPDDSPHATEAGKGAKPPKDCSDKHHKVYLLEQEKKQADAKTRQAAKADKAAYSEYLIWAHDHDKGPKYYELYMLAYQAHLEAWKDGAAVTKKLNEAKMAEQRCLSQAYSG